MLKKLSILALFSLFALSGCYDAKENLKGEKMKTKEIHNMNTEDLFSMKEFLKCPYRLMGSGLFMFWLTRQFRIINFTVIYGQHQLKAITQFNLHK